MFGCFALRPRATMSARALPLAEALADRGHDVTVLVPPYEDPAHPATSETVGGVEIRHLAIGGTTRVARLKSALSMVAAARRSRPDVVHLFKPTGYPGLAGALQETISRVPFVVDCDDW